MTVRLEYLVPPFAPWLLDVRGQAWVPLLVSFFLVACANTSNHETRPFFQEEQETSTHGRKTLLDRVVETDPGGFDVKVSSEFKRQPPGRIAVLPFADEGSANFVVDKIPVTHRTQRERFNWAWTDSQRLRRAIQGYLSQREFEVMPLVAVDAVIKARGIDTPEKLDRVPPNELGRLLGVDAVVYGTVLYYEAYYFLLVATWRVGVEVKLVSTQDGHTLIKANGSRYAQEVAPALTPVDVVINSLENLMQLRDIELARAEEETCREIVLRIPRSAELEERLKHEALVRAELISAETDAPIQTVSYLGRTRSN